VKTADKNEKWLWFTLPAWGHTIPVARLIGLIDVNSNCSHTIYSEKPWADYFKKNCQEVDIKTYQEDLGLKFEVNKTTYKSGTETLLASLSELQLMAQDLKNRDVKITKDYDYIICDVVLLPLVKILLPTNTKILTYQTSLDLPIKIAKKVVWKYLFSKVGKELYKSAWQTIITTTRRQKLINTLNKNFQLSLNQYTMMHPDGVPIICLTSIYFQPFSHLILDTYFIGPLLERRQNNHKKSKRAYVSLGTMSVSDNHILKVITKVLLEKNYQVSVKIPDTDCKAAWLSDERITAKTFFNQPQELDEADLFVTHAGMNSIDEAIASETPTICIPQANDQFIVAARVEELGLGIIADQNVTEKSFADAVKLFEANKSKLSKNLKAGSEKHLYQNSDEINRLFDELGFNPISSSNKKKK